MKNLMGNLRYYARYAAGYVRGKLGFRIFEAELRQGAGVYIRGIAEGAGMSLGDYARERNRRRKGR